MILICYDDVRDIGTGKRKKEKTYISGERRMIETSHKRHEGLRPA